MNICMLVGTDMSHDARVWKEAIALVSVGHKVTVLAAHSEQLPSEEIVDNVHVIRVTPQTLRSQKEQPYKDSSKARLKSHVSTSNKHPTRPLFSGLREKLWRLRVIFRTLAHIRQINPDIIHIHDADRLFTGGIACCLQRIPFVFDSHEYVAGMYMSKKRAILLKWYILLEKFLAPRALAVITTNLATRQRLENQYSIKEYAIVHNYPMRYEGSLNNSALRGKIPEEHKHRPVLLYQGRLTAERGIEVFVRAIANLPTVVGVVIGSGPLEEELRRLSEECELGNRMVFIPQVPWSKLLEYTAGADIGFCLSQNTCENNYIAEPNKVFEYLMVGVPVVASDFPGLRECVVQEDVGVVAQPDDVSAVAKATRELLDNPEVLSKMKKRALLIAQEKFNWDYAKLPLIDLYFSIQQKQALATAD